MLALKIELYVPLVIPIRRARMNVWIVAPPKSRRAVNVNTTGDYAIKLRVASERPKVAQLVR